MNEVTGKSVLSLDELMRGMKIHFRHRRLIRMGVYQLIGALFLLVSAAYFLRRGGPFLGPSLSCGFLGVYFLCLPFLTRMLVRHRLKSNPNLGKEITWGFSDERFRAEGEGFHSSAEWPTYYEAILSGAGILIYPQKQLFNWIPATAFASEADFTAAKEIVERNIRRCKKV